MSKAGSEFQMVNGAFLAVQQFALRRVFRRVANLAPLLLLAACAGAPERAELPPPLAFPSPPEQPRFWFEGSLRSSAQLEVADGKSRLRMLLTGEQRSGDGFAKPFDVAACGGTIYVSDSVSRTVLAFDAIGRRFFRIGEQEPGGLTKPLGLNTDAACRLYVVDATARQVLVYTADGQYLRSIGRPEDFQRPSHVAPSADGEVVYVVDTGGVDVEEHRVRAYAGQSGEHLFDIGTRGDGDGQLNLPRDAEVGPDGLLYVVDGGNFRVQVFDAEGRFVRGFGSVGRQLGQFARPKGLGIDPQGNLYVSDAAFGNFQIFTPRGELLLFIGNRGTRDGRATYMLPAGLDVDADGRVLLIDQFFRKVDIYRPATLPAEGGSLGPWLSGAAPPDAG